MMIIRVSVYRAVEKLKNKKSVSKDSDGQVVLTENGKLVALRYLKCVEQIEKVLLMCVNSSATLARKDAIAIAGVMSQENIQKMLDMLSEKEKENANSVCTNRN